MLCFARLDAVGEMKTRAANLMNPTKAAACLLLGSQTPLQSFGGVGSFDLHLSSSRDSCSSKFPEFRKKWKVKQGSKVDSHFFYFIIKACIKD